MNLLGWDARITYEMMSSAEYNREDLHLLTG
jgi:hypothetical protein